MGYPLTYLYLACLVAMVAAGTAIWLTVPPQPARKWILLTPFCIGAWSLSDFLSNLATQPETFHIIGWVFAPVWAATPFLVLWVAIHYALPEASRWRSSLAGAFLLVPFPACLALSYTSSLHDRVAPATENGQFFVPQATPWHLLPIGYFLLYVALAALVLHRAARRTGEPMVQALSHFFVRGMIPAVIIGALANGGLSLMGQEAPHIGSVMAAVLIGVVAVGVARKGFFQPLHEVLRDRDEAMESLSRREELLTAMPFGLGIVSLEDCRLVFRNAPFAAQVQDGQVKVLLEEVRSQFRSEACHRGETRSTELVLDPDSSPPRVLQVHAVGFSYGGQAACLLGVRDISRERSLEERLRQAEQLKALGTLAGGIAHDMNNILAVILLLADGMDFETPRPEALSKAARRIVGACRRGRDLTGNILAFTHQRTPQWSTVSVPTLIQATLEQMRPSLPTGVALEVSLAPELPDLLGDETQLQQALVNLCRNAAEAMPKGGRIHIAADLFRRQASKAPGAANEGLDQELLPVPGATPSTGLGRLSGSTYFPGLASLPGQLPIKRPDPRPGPRPDPRPDPRSAMGTRPGDTPGGEGGAPRVVRPAGQTFLRLRVEDNGEGMDDGTRRRCLEPLFTTKPIGRGTGLGLAVVYSTVSRHGGSLLVESEPGQGTRMTLLLPLPESAIHNGSEEAERPPSTPSWRVPPGAPSPGVLLVEDEDELRQLAREELEAIGCRVMDAADGHQALQRHQEHRDAVDLVLLDLVMPELDGAETFRQLRARDPGLPVVLMSGYGHEADVEKLLEDGANDFLAKPFDRRGLAASVRRALAGRANGDSVASRPA